MSARTLPLPAEAAFALVTDLSRHGEWIPLTRMDVPRRPLRVGDAVVATTARVLVDRMTVVRLDPPLGGDDGVAVLRKNGPLLLGAARITVRSAGPGRARVVWDEDVWLRGPLPRGLSRGLLAPFLDAMGALALWRIGRSVRRSSTP